MSWLGAASAAVKPLWFLYITMVCMRLLGVEGYGVMSAALALAALATSFTDLGVTEYSMREVARDRARISLFFTNFLLFRVGLSVVVCLALIGCAALLGYRHHELLAVAFAGIYTIVLTLTNYCRVAFEVFEDLRAEAISLVLEKALVIAGGTALLLITAQPAWTLAGMAAGVTLITAANVVWISRRLAPLDAQLFSVPFIAQHLRYALPFGVGGIFFLLYTRTDMLMIKEMIGVEAAGQYGAAYRILEALYLLPGIVAHAALYPRLCRLYRPDTIAAYNRLLKQGLLLLGLMSVTVAGILWLEAPRLIRFLDSEPLFAPAGPALQVLCWTYPLISLNALLYLALLSMDEQHFRAAALLGGVVCNIGLNLFLIPRYGINGAAFATVLAELLILLLYALRILHKNPGLKAWRAVRVPGSAP